MKSIMIIARKEVKTAFRDHILLIIIGLFFLLSIISVYIGASTKNAELMAYQDIITLLKSQGSSLFPAKPEIFPLAILSNMVTYVSMIGAVVAIFLGFDAFGKEKKQGTIKLIEVRPLFRDQIITGKILGGALVIGSLLSVILIVNLVLFSATLKMVPSGQELIRLFTFFLLSFAYMMLFYLITLWVSLRSGKSEFGFLLMMILWMGISFVIPQIADSQKNFVYSMSATAQTVTQLPTETFFSTAIEWLSPAFQFETIGKHLLQVHAETANLGVGRVLVNHLFSLLEVLIPSFAVGLLIYKDAQKEGRL